MKLFDISIPISNKTLVYKDDVPFEIQKKITKIDNGSITTSNISMSSHTGTHIDAPHHFFNDGITIDEINPELFIGSTYVAEILDHDEQIGEKQIENITIPNGISRILFKTNNSTLWKKHEVQSNFTSLSLYAAEWLINNNIQLVGIDYLSVDTFTTSSFPIHQKLLKNNVIILEGLDLSRISQGIYTLICFPLNIISGDGSPARAILIEE